VTSSYLHFVIAPIVRLPEPAILVLLGGGLFALAGLVRGGLSDQSLAKQHRKLKSLSSGKPLIPKCQRCEHAQFTLRIDAK